MEQLECKHCGHRWYKRIKIPVQCPKCRRRIYTIGDIEMKERNEIEIEKEAGEKHEK